MRGRLAAVALALFVTVAVLTAPVVASLTAAGTVAASSEFRASEELASGAPVGGQGETTFNDSWEDNDVTEWQEEMGSSNRHQLRSKEAHNGSYSFQIGDDGDTTGDAYTIYNGSDDSVDKFSGRREFVTWANITDQSLNSAIIPISINNSTSGGNESWSIGLHAFNNGVYLLEEDDSENNVNNYTIKSSIPKDKWVKFNLTIINDTHVYAAVGSTSKIVEYNGSWKSEDKAFRFGLNSNSEKVYAWIDDNEVVNHTAPPSESSSSGVEQQLIFNDSTGNWGPEATEHQLWRRADPDRDAEWVHIGTQEPNWNGSTTWTDLNGSREYWWQVNNEVLHERYDYVGWTPANLSDPYVFTFGTNQVFTETPTPTGTATASSTSGEDLVVDTGTNRDGATITFGSDSRNISSVDYTLEGPNGTTYNYSETFDESLERYYATISEEETGTIENPSAWSLNYSVTDTNGTTYNGSLTLGEGENVLTGEPLESGGAIVGPGVDGGGGGGPGPLAVGGVLAVAGGAYALTRPGVREALSSAAGSVAQRVTP